MDTKSFDISDVLSITTGALVSRDGIGSVYEIMGYVIGDPHITTIGLAMMATHAKALVLNQHPQLAGVEFPSMDEALGNDGRRAFIDRWLDEQELKFGRRLDIAAPSDPILVSFQSQVDYVHNLNPTAKVIGIELQ